VSTEVDFDGRKVTCGIGELDELMLAYATTIHQSQGLGIPNRGDPADDPALSDAAAEPGYTGISRGKSLVVLVGQRKALTIAIKGAGSRKRWSKPREWLTASSVSPFRRA
jgi:exodeoxyribonuclease V alpha subunit